MLRTFGASSYVSTDGRADGATHESAFHGNNHTNTSQFRYFSPLSPSRYPPKCYGTYAGTHTISTVPTQFLRYLCKFYGTHTILK